MKQRASRSETGEGDRGYKIVPTRYGVRMVQHGTVLSEIRTTPGPTYSVADVIACVVRAVSTGPQVAMLGFAGGGVLAPLRAMGGGQAGAAVDLDDSGWKLFQRLCASWAGAVSFDKAEACAWLRGSNQRYDVIIEDLSVPTNSDVFKPAVTWAELPSLVYRQLEVDGVAIFNLLRPTDGPWDFGIRRILRSDMAAHVVHFTDYENRLLIVGKTLPSARTLSQKMRANLRSIHSRQASRISVRHLVG